ncbi:hypothetical protein ABW20_dc0101519 [Dactylellina cionopaga]|nr:hypothetical protein ABW20_dc0101519 [Dactylellina cionopaga]
MCQSNGFWVPVATGGSYTFPGTVTITSSTVDSVPPVPPGPYTPNSNQTFAGNLYAFGPFPANPFSWYISFSPNGTFDAEADAAAPHNRVYITEWDKLKFKQLKTAIHFAQLAKEQFKDDPQRLDFIKETEDKMKEALKDKQKEDGEEDVGL